MTTQADAAAARHQLIADRLETVGRVEVVELAARLNVAQETIRRDLKLLDQQGLLERVHGGAVRRTPRPLSPFDASARDDEPGLLELAHAVADRLPETGTVFIGSSPLTWAVAEALSRRECGNLQVVTTSLDVAVTLSRSESMRVYNVGGSLDPTTRTQLGDWALSEIERFRVDVAVLPTSGVTVEGIFVDTPMEAAVTAASVSTARQVWLVLESSGLGREGFVHAAPLDRVRVIFVNGRLSARQTSFLDDLDLEVVVVTAEDLPT